MEKLPAYLSLTLLVVGLPLLSFAQQYQLLEPSVLLNSGSTGPVDFITYLRGIFGTIMVMAVALTIVMLVVSGIEYVASGAPGAKEDARKRWQNALFGLGIALTAWVLLDTINPDVLKFDPALITPI